MTITSLPVRFDHSGVAHSAHRSIGMFAIVPTLVLALAACSSSTEPPITGSPSAPSSTLAPTTSEAPSSPSTTAGAPADLATLPFDIPIGVDGVTYDLDGSPPSGPSSFAVLDDGSVVITDTMAVARGEPRLLHYDRMGEMQGTIDLAGEDVAAIADVATDGSDLAILDVLIAMNRYRVLTLSLDGQVTATIDVPQGFRFEDGLTGLVWDDGGILLEFEFGARYARVTDDGTIEPVLAPTFGGISIELIPGSGRTTEIVTSRTSFTVERETNLGGVTPIGIGPNGWVTVVVDEVDVSGPTIVVMRRVQRYSATGQLETESIIDAADQFIEVPRPFELDATGQVIYLQTWPDRVTIAPLGV